jgi:hypothetical protein
MTMDLATPAAEAAAILGRLGVRATWTGGDADRALADHRRDHRRGAH